MTDDEFLAAFESCVLRSEDFHHVDHVRLGFLYLRRFPGLEAVQKFSEGLRTFARSLGKADLYHETITWAFLFLIRERVERRNAADWEQFAALNADLLDWKNSILKTYYRDETLASPLAKRIFVLPDRR